MGEFEDRFMSAVVIHGPQGQALGVRGAADDVDAVKDEVTVPADYV